MKSRKNKKFKTTLSLALLSCFGFAPSADATDVDVVNMVNSISGILGGNYSLSTPSGNPPSGGGVFNNTATGASWGNSNIAPITSTTSAGVSTLGNAAAQSSIGNGTLNNPYASSYNLYGNDGLLNNWIGNASLPSNLSNNQLGIYSLSAVNSLAQILQGNATTAYGARAAFGGVQGPNNILDPNTAINNNYFNISNQGSGNTASVKGALTASQIGSSYTTTQVNNLAGGVYTNITQLTDAINTLSQDKFTAGSLGTYSQDLSSALSSISSIGGQFVNASSGLSAALTNLGSIINTGNTPLIGSTTEANGAIKYTVVSTNALDTLSAINQINTDVGGIASSATKVNPNYVTVMQILGNDLSNFQVIANGVLNTPLQDVTNSSAASTPTAAANLNAVLNILHGMSGGQTAASLKGALQGLVNPNTNYQTTTALNNQMVHGDGYEAVYNAYTAVASNLSKLQGIFGTSNLGDTLIKALEVNQLLNTVKANLTDTSANASTNSSLATAFKASGSFGDATIGANSLTQLFNAFGNGTSSNYTTLTTLLGKLAGYLNTNGIDTGVSAQSANTTTTTTGTAGNASTNTTSTNTTTAYPMAGPNASASNNGVTTVTSWITTRISNQATYNTAYNKALGQLLGYAMSYNTNSTALGKMLSSSVSLSNILTQGINDAAANVMFNGGATNTTNTADDINNQAQQLNNIKAIFQSEDLLNSYVGAITQNYSNSPISVQQAQASALDYLYNALSAGTAQNGLIAQTKEAIANALNNNLVASNLPAQALQIVNSISPSLFQPNLTTQQMVTGLSDLSSTFTSYLGSVTDTSSLGTVMTGLQSLSTVATDLQTLQNLASSVGHAINIPEILTQVIGNGTVAVAPESSAAFGTAFDGTSVKATALNILTNLVGAANSTTATTTDTFNSSPLGKLIAALNAGTGNGVAVNSANTTSSNLSTIVDAVPQIVSGLQRAETNGLNLTELEALATGSAAQKADAVKYISDISDLPKQIGYATGVSARQNFLDGKLTVADISNQIQALKAQIASYENMDTNATGNAGLNIGLSSMLGTSISSVQNLGFANAAVNTLKTQLAQALPLLVGGESANFNISTVQGLVADLNKAVGALYSGTNGNIFFNNGEMQTVSNMNNNTVNVSPNTFGLGGGGGVPANAKNGGSPHYYNNELTNLANLNTINSLLSGGILTSNAISTSYNGAFGAQTSGNYGFAGQIATDAQSTYASNGTATAYQALTANLASGVTLADVVDALLPIGQELAAGTITSNTAKTDAITALTPLINTPGTNAQYVWAAYSAVMGLGASGTSAVAGLNNLLSSKQDLSTVAGVTTVLQDANSLVSANRALTSTMSDLNGSQVLTVASGNVPNTAENLNNAIAAATALGNLLKQINPADLTNPIGGANTAVGSATTVINAINSYNHNVQLLNNLTNGNGAKIAGDVIAYLQGNTSYNSLTGNSVTNTAINNLQNLLNRYEYLQGLQSQVQAAIANNPYALIMQQNQVLKSDGYQEAAKALVSTTGVGPDTGGLFNVAVSSTISPGASSTFDLNNTAFTNLASTVGNDIANAQNWNAYFTNLMSPSNSILSTPTSGAGTQASSYLNTIAGSIYNLAGYFTPASVSNNKVVTTNLTSSIDSALGAYNAISAAITTLQSNTTLNLASASSFDLGNLTTAGAGASGSGFNTTAATGATAVTNLTFLDVAQSIVDISGMLTPKGSQTNGIVGNQALINSIQTVMGDSTGTSSTIQGTAGQLAAIFKQAAGAHVTAFDMSHNLPTSIPTISGGNVSVATRTAADTITSMSNASVAIVSGIVQAIENNSTLQGFLANPSSFTAGTNDANIIALQNTIAKYVGGDAQTYSGGSLTGGSGNAAVLNSAAIATQFLANLNKFVGQGGALQSLNSNFKPSVRAGVANFNSPAFVSNVEKMLNNALNWSTNYDNALRAVQSGQTLTGTTVGASSVAISNATTYNAIASIAKNADTLFNNDALTANATNNGGALATATQALSQFALANGVNGASPDTNNVPATAAGASTLAGLMAYYLYQDLKTSYPNLDGAPIAAVISAATPAQLAAAATQVLGSTQFKGSTAMQQNLINTTLSNMLTQAKDYTNAAVGTTAGAAGGLSGLLNSKTTIQDVLQTAIANAASMHNLNGVLNPNNSDRVSVSKGQLSTTSINTINKLLGAMTAANGNLPTINPNTPVGAEAKMLLAMVAANNAATNALGLLSATGGATSGSAQTYFQNVTTFINDQATLLAKQNSTVVQLLEGMTQAVANSTSTDQQAQNAFGALKAVYTQIASPTINYTSAMNNLIGVIHQLENLQQSLVDQLAANQGQPGVNTASVDGLGTLAAEVQKGFGDTSNMTPQQVQAATKLLNQIQSALTYAKAAQLKMSQMLANRGIMTAYGAASHMPMQTMNSNGNMYGIDVQFGYKQFFGKKKRWGVRYYANFSYQHGTFMVSNAAELDNFVYGAGVDALYNFYESKDGKYTSGLFAGLMLEGSSWAVKGQSYYQAMMNAFNATGGHATMNTSYFQIPINIGFRTNVNKHNGFEIGLRIPLATNYYFKGVSAAGQKLDIAYKRNVSVFFNYVYNF
ncbi:outer membrane protein [Helicobacter ailurogastricus]|uniref:Uncharacterized protein n=1 Tax=Helicobacter ailurogastricus TaxID=1578720 RepID=A0A0K2X680_9HELI|nr:outer membrane protein [Helicobacter ailurogastricus]CRF41088.1 hypothetical protein HAL011_08710 [Helicobacter ailurogastricus]CRF43868.1 hypothetical protein HAL09_04240 [Helicobacter ailurogastricus]